MRLLLVEDDPELGTMMLEALSHLGHVADHVSTGTDALWLSGEHRYDAVILDVGLPDMTGLEVCARLRSAHPALPLLMLTGRAAVRDRVQGLDAGADDYLAKPVSLAELDARLRALARRADRPAVACHQVGDVVVHPATREVFRGERPVPLAGREYAFVELLARRAGHVVRRTELVAGLWEADAEVTPNALDVLVAAVRRKLDVPFEKPVLQTVRGVGYRLGSPAQVRHR